MITDLDEIAGYVAEFDSAMHALEHRKTYLSIERLLARVSEAVARIRRAGAPLSELEPDVPWRDIHGFGNIVPHDYESVELSSVADILQNHLQPLRAAALRLKARFDAEAS